MLVNLSYPITTEMPVYAGAPPVEITPHRLISQGFKYNTYRVQLWNHCGTHMDAPRHVYDNGPALSDLPVEWFAFENPCVVNLPTPEDSLIEPSDLQQVLQPGDLWDLVIIRTGFGQYRDTEPERYADHNPGFGQAAARWLVDSLPRLRAVGVDIISLTSAAHPDEGWQAHRVLLNPEAPRLVIEDLHIPPDLPQLKRVYAVPTLIRGVDSCWCTVIAETSERS